MKNEGSKGQSTGHTFVQNIEPHVLGFWATVCKTVRPMLSDRCLSVCPVLSVCDVGVLWPNGWTDQDETLHAGRPRPWPHCLRWGPSSPSPKVSAAPSNSRPISVVAKWLDGSRCHLVWSLDRTRSGVCVRWGPSFPLPKKGTEPPPQFSAHFYCGQTAGCIKMPLGIEVRLSPGDFVLDGDPAPFPKRGQSPPPQFSAHIYCGETAARTKMPLGMEVGLGPGDFVFDGNPARPRHTHPTQFLAHVYCGQTAGWIKMPLRTEVNLGPGDVVHGVAAPHEKGHSPPPSFRFMSIVAKWLHG